MTILLLDRLDAEERFALLKMATGALRIGVSARLAKTALATAFGIDVEAVERACRKHKVRAVFLTPHHQFPTTVALRPERRLRLLELARQFAYAAEVQLGNTDNNLGSNLQADCYAGVYAYSGFSVNRGDDQILVLSPGALDEAVIAFLLTSDSSADIDENGSTSVGTAFTRFEAYRTGFLSGIDACDDLAAQANSGD